jgi:hypothetical protein
VEKKPFFKTKFMQDDQNPHPRIREDSVDIWLEESSMFLSLTRCSDSRSLEHIAWDNIRNIYPGLVDKKGVSTLLMNLSWAAGGHSSSYHDGVMIDYKDEEFERVLSVFFKTGGKSSANKLIRLLWQKRDHHISSGGRRADIRR